MQITEKLLESPSDQFDDEEYADLIDYHVDSAREDEAHTETDEDEPIWKRRNSVQHATADAILYQHSPCVTTNAFVCREQRPVRPLNLAEDPTDLELVGARLLLLSTLSPPLISLVILLALASTANIRGGKSLWWRLHSRK